jgi:AbrB family looped-hinge helix DNA binding protein
METTATAKGQIVIPSSIRRKFDIKEGTRIQIEVDEEAHQIILKPITRQFIRSLRGKYRNSGLMDELMAEKRRERDL